jgi:hypothetical protein
VTKGFYGGGTFGWPTPIGGVGAGLYFDDHENFYPQIYYGTPRAGISAGYSPDLEGFLTGTSVSGNFGNGLFKYNLGASQGSAGGGVGTPGFGVTYGFGPYKVTPAPPDAAGEVNPAIYSTGFGLPDSNEQDSFDSRFGKWGPDPTGNPGAPSSPVLRELMKYRRSTTEPVPTLTQGAPSTISAQPNATYSPTGEDIRNPPRLNDRKPARYLGRRVVNP